MSLNNLDQNDALRDASKPLRPVDVLPQRDLSGLRSEYARGTLDEQDVSEDPNCLFAAWLEEAISAQPEAHAMTLASVGPNLRPSTRVVLLKQFDPRGLVWFSHYTSRKGRDLQANAAGACQFFWDRLERMVRVEGYCHALSRQESSAYFATRPLASRVGAWASDQSSIVSSRAELEADWQQASQMLGDNPRCPPRWGGFCLVPDYWEFWQGRPSRLHDRLVYTRAPGMSWRLRRLAP